MKQWKEHQNRMKKGTAKANVDAGKKAKEISILWWLPVVIMWMFHED
jgi:hypothetical protein